MTRTELATALGVSSAAITQVTKDLLAQGMVTELDQIASSGGRPARPLALVSTAGSVVGVKITASHLAVVAAGLDGTVESTATFPFDATNSDAIDLAASHVSDVVKSADQPVLGVGVGVPGAVDSVESGVVDAPTIGLRQARLGFAWRQRLGVPVLVENDVNALAVAEQVYGIGRSHATYLVVTIGRGIGCGIVIDGQLFRGSAGGAGELGHIPLVDDGAPCPYGHSGCLESLIGSAGLLRRAKQIGLPGSAKLSEDDPALIDHLARVAVDKALTDELFGWAGRHLGTSVAGAVNLLDPEVVVILGEGTEQWPLWKAGFEAACRARLIDSRRCVPYLVDAWDEDKWALGAAALVIATLFDRDGTTGLQGELVRERLSVAHCREIRPKSP